MKRESLSRRDFLKLGGLSLAGFAYRSLAPGMFPWPQEELPHGEMTGRVAKNNLPVYTRPDFKSGRIRKIPRDSLLPLLEEVSSPYGPRHNPRWYRLLDGFIHSGDIQRVEKAHLNSPVGSMPESGVLGEVTVPFTRTTYKSRKGYWMPLYRLYFQSVHWVTGATESPEGLPWYRLTDEWLRVHYYVPAEHIRLISTEELAPIAPVVPAAQKRIEVSISAQEVSAYEGERAVLKTRVSTGKRYMETPQGDFQVERKFPSKHMGDGGLTGKLNAYELVGVPWVTFFHPAGIAFHGTFWHDNFGAPMSRGCVNMRNEEARWLFRWCMPSYDPQVEDRAGWKLVAPGTRVVVT